MLQRPRALPRQPGAAFTLIELILVVALVSLLLGAVAFNFGALSRGQSLEEGATQFEALLRLSRANAAATGRPVLLALLAATNAASDGSPAALSLAVLSQPDPLRQPDLYRTLPSTQYLLTQLADLIRLEIPLPKPSSDPSDPSDPSDQSTPPASTPFTPILTFNPDGSSDAADFILLPQDPEDRRRIHIHVDAITGTLHRRYLSAEPGRPDNELPSEDEFPEEEESMEPDPAFITADPNGTSPATEAAKPSKPSRAP
jgi:type II secretory pathway pseudopilin PulG